MTRFTVTRFANYSAQQHGTTSKYDSLSLQTEQDIYDFGPTGRGPLLSKEQWGYNESGPVAEMTEDMVFDGSSNQLSRTDYSYDARTPVATSGLPNHLNVGTAQRGNRTSIVNEIGTGTPTTTIIYDDAGQPQTSVIRRNTLLQRQIAEHTVLNSLVSTHTQ